MKDLRYEGAPKYLGESSQAQKRVWKQNDGILNFQFKWLIGMDANRCADKPGQNICACAMVFPPNDRADYHDITW